MRSVGIVPTLLAVLLGVRVVAQRPQSKAAQTHTKQVKPAGVVEEWFSRWNELDGTPEKTARLVELYSPVAMQFMGPGPDQLGTLSFTGEAKLKAMAEQFGKLHSGITFRINQMTMNEKTATLFPVTEAPWGGVEAAVEFTGAYNDRATNKRYTFPGAAFFLIEDGKIHRLRLYRDTEETAEVK